jgi:exonuclease VII large subunit
METVRLAEATVRSTATGLQPGARMLLDDTRSAVISARTAIDRHARDTVRIAETTVRTTAAALEPGARALLDDVQAAVGMALESTRAASRQRRELADQAVRNLRRSITSSVETTIRPLELGAGKALSEISARLEAIPQSAADKVGVVLRDITEAAGRSTSFVGEMVTSLRQQAILDAKRSLNDCQSSIAVIRERAESLHPRTVLAAGYAILRDRTGVPLTGVAAVRRTGLITAEMRDGGIDLRNTDADRQEEAS